MQSTTHSAVSPPTLEKVRQSVLLADGLFLTLMGGLFVIFDLWSFYAGRGPLGPILHDVQYTIAFVEAHGLACILGLHLLRAGWSDRQPVWCLTGAVIHLLLGVCNLLFWELAIQWDVVALEVIVTSIHALFFLLQLGCWSISVMRVGDITPS